MKKKLFLFPALFLLSAVISFFLFHFVNPQPVYPELVEGQRVNLPTSNLQPIYPSVAFGEGGQPTTYNHPLSLSDIFSSDHSFLSSLPQDHLRTLITTGDVVLGRSVNTQTIRRNNFLWPWEKTADFLKNADITFINLETPLINSCPVTDSGMIFCGDARHIEGLKYAGVDIVNLANNHAGNWGQKGIEETVGLLEKAGILVMGIANDSSTPGESPRNTPGVSWGSTIIAVGGLRFAFLGFCELEHTADYAIWKDTVASKIENATASTDVIVAAFHWGWEYTDRPNDRQMELAHLAIEAGADLIVGNHPHWIQPVEI